MQSVEPARAMLEADVPETFVWFDFVLLPQCRQMLLVRVVIGEVAAYYFGRLLEMSFVEPGWLTLLWNLWEREIGILEIKVNGKADANGWMCGMARECAKAKSFLSDVNRSTELSGDNLS